MQPFTYQRADSPRKALQSATEHGASFLAGGTTLLDLMKLNVLRSTHLVDINDLAESHGAITVDAAGLHLGALVHMADAAAHPVIQRDYPVIAESLLLAASAQIRNMATLGGNVLQRTRCTYFRDTAWQACNKRNPGSGCAAIDGVNRKHAVLGDSADCIATYPGDFSQALIALDANVHIAGAGGNRTMKFAELHRLPGATPHIETDLSAEELITGFTVPAGDWTKRSLYLKIRDRQSYEFALVSAAVALHLEGNQVRIARIAIGGVATKPWRAHAAEAALTGKELNESTAANAAKIALAGAKGRQGNAFKIDLARRTLVRALLQAQTMTV